MHGLINCAVQCYVSDSYGTDKWLEVAREADLDFVDFEAMLIYDAALTPRILDASAKVLDRPRADIMEDMGTFLVTNPNVQALRRLLRFGGVTFVEFLHSLDDLPDRVRLAVADLHLPKIELLDHNEARFSLVCDATITGFGNVMMGMLRTMADDYGALVFLEHDGSVAGVETVSITLIEQEFAAGRSFELGATEI